MIHVYKAGGDWKASTGESYTIKSVNSMAEAGEGFYGSLEGALAAEKPKSQKPAKFKKEVGSTE
jgi:hypothetical protein|tara:strand:+ start:2813 stop:3004 length:192 start_codon:yes stop_codon:yes gene_type:complete